MSKTPSQSHVVLMGIFLAMVGFSYALATSGNLLVSTTSPVRAVGSSKLEFTNPFVSGSTTIRDLGDVVAGSTLVRAVQRYATAKGGVPPYKFASTSTPTLTSVKGTSTLQLFENGLLTTAMAGSVGSLGSLAAGNLDFMVDVTDSLAGSQSNSAKSMFRLVLLPSTGAFKFAVSSLPDAVQYQDYKAAVDVVYGSGSYEFTATVSSPTTATKLEDIGLSISKVDGTIFGKPIVSGSVTFKVSCHDTVKNADAKSRDGTATGQTFTVIVASNSTVSNTVIATSIQIKLDTANGGKDSIKYAGIANLAGASVSEFDTQVLEFRIGNYVTPNTSETPAALDNKGKISKPNSKSKTAVTLAGSINSKGQLKVAVGKETLGTKLSLNTSSGTVKLAVSVLVGKFIIGTEILEFSDKVSGTKHSLSYKLGSGAKAGAFMISSVAGKDDTKGADEGDAWKVAFVALPPSGTFDGSTATVTIGSVSTSGFSDAVSITVSKNKIKSGKVDAKTANKVTKLAMDGSKGKGSLQTSYATKAKTGIPEAESAPALTGSDYQFALGISLNATGANAWSGNGSLAIFGKGKGWTSTNPTK